jgi:O-antigen ligase
LIKQHPFQGYGDTARTTPAFPEKALSYSSQYVRETVFLVGFHNELIATTVRSGLLGGTAILLVFVVPLIIFVRQISNSALSKSHAAALGTCLVLIVSISSLTIETFGLKFASSFYALMVAMLLSQTLRVDHAGN